MCKNGLACFVTALSLASPAGAAEPPAAVEASPPAAEEPPPGTDATAGFGWLGMLAGHCWHGEHGNGSDTQCYSWQYGRYLRGTIVMEAVRQDNTMAWLSGDSVFAVDEKTGRLRYASWSDVGKLLFREAYYDGETLHFPDVTGRDEEPRGRQSWRRIDAESFEVTRENRDGEEWKPGIRVTYRRVAAEPSPPPAS